MVALPAQHEARNYYSTDKVTAKRKHCNVILGKKYAAK
jgi:hypothetical protein